MNGCGIFTWYGFVLPLNDNLKLIKQAGFSSVMMWYGNEFIELNGDFKNIPETAYKYGIKVDNAHIPYYRCDNIWFDNLDGEALLKKYYDDITLAKSIGIDTLVMHPFEITIPEKGKKKTAFERFEKLSLVALKYNIKLAIENLGDNKTLTELINYLSENKCVGLCFDSGHNNINSSDPTLLLNSFSNRLFAIHIHDNNSKEDQHLLPFEGNINWNRITTAINATGYSRSFALESALPYNPIEDMANSNNEQKAAEYLQKAYNCAYKASNFI